VDLTDKVAIVTGGTRGIGLAIVEALLERGAKVVVGARTVQDALKTLSRKAPGRVVAQACDVRRIGQARRLVGKAVDEFSGLDILINNAGVGRFAAIDELAPEDWAAVIETNLTGVYNCCHEAVPVMRLRQGGHIVNIGSLAGRNAFAGGAAYNASKFGLVGLSEAIMQDVRQQNIRVTTVAPGSVATEFSGRKPAPKHNWKLKPADVARVVVDVLTLDNHALSSYVELRPAKPPR
jgi:NAD(P)-dependent dehydrogenase (short-subunit alcohol dehydrogenase family)